MLDGLALLLMLSVLMFVASFAAGVVPISMSLSSSRLRIISTIGMGVLVGTALVVIIPEGIEAIYTSTSAASLHTRREFELYRARTWPVNAGIAPLLKVRSISTQEERQAGFTSGRVDIRDTTSAVTTHPAAEGNASPPQVDKTKEDGQHNKDAEPPTFWIGLALIMGFAGMFLLDRVPRLASENLQAPPPTRHIALDNLSMRDTSLAVDEESESFLRSMAPTPKQTRSLATTAGLVAHAFADGIAMGASASTSNTELGIIVFFAIMIHKAPAAFGLTSILLKQGLSKRATRGHLILFSLAAPLGALSTWLLVSILGGSHIEGPRGQFWTGFLLLISGGTFLYVAVHAMQEESTHDHPVSNGYAEIPNAQRNKSKPQMKDTLYALLGMAFPLLTQLVHHH